MFELDSGIANLSAIDSVHEINKYSKSILEKIKSGINLTRPLLMKSNIDAYNSVKEDLTLIAELSFPTAIGFVMHYYPLCALRGLPIGSFHPLNWVKGSLLKRIKNDKSIIANAGGERTNKKENTIFAAKQYFGQF